MAMSASCTHATHGSRDDRVVDRVVVGAEEVPPAPERVRGQRVGVLALTEEQREVVAEEPPDGQRHQRPTERFEEATVAVLLALTAARRRARRRGTPPATIAVIHSEPDGVEQRARPPGAGAEHVQPERPGGEPVERGAADPHEHQDRRCRRPAGRPPTPDTDAGDAAESAPNASPVASHARPHRSPPATAASRVGDEEHGERARGPRPVVGEEVPGPRGEERGRRPRRARRAPGRCATPVEEGHHRYERVQVAHDVAEQQAHDRQAHPPHDRRRARAPGWRRSSRVR